MVLRTHLEPFRETLKVPPVGQPKNLFFSKSVHVVTTDYSLRKYASLGFNGTALQALTVWSRHYTPDSTEQSQHVCSESVRKRMRMSTGVGGGGGGGFCRGVYYNHGNPSVELEPKRGFKARPTTNMCMDITFIESWF